MDQPLRKNGANGGVRNHLKTEYPDYEPKKSYCISVGKFKAMDGNKIKDENDIWYPSDQLRFVPWQAVKKTIRNELSQDILKYATCPPVRTIQKIEEGMKEFNNDGFYKNFGFALERSTTKCDASVLFPPKLKLSPQVPKQVINGSWNFDNQTKFFQGLSGKTTDMVVVVVNQTDTAKVEKLKGLTDKLFETYKIHASGSTLKRIACFTITVPTDGRTDSYRELCQEAFQSNRKPNSINDLMIIFILPKKDTDIYPEVKRWADCQVGIPSICVTSEKLTKSENDSKIRSNMCLKLHLKLGRVTHQIVPTGAGSSHMLGAEPGTMIMGADVTHPGARVGTCPSMAAVVATDDDVSSQYLGSARLQKSKQESIDDLAGMVEERVIAWFNKAGEAKSSLRLPANIIFYRDGVSESQFKTVLDSEKKQIMDGCRAATKALLQDQDAKLTTKEQAWSPKLALLIFIKRHHVRFYHNDKSDLAKGNLPCGTAVHKTVVLPNYQNFYLQSHSSDSKTTARNAHYVILHNDTQLKLDRLGAITNNICYTGARATKALSVCTPARYADHLCDRLRYYMKPVIEGKAEYTCTSSDYLKVREKDERVWRPKGAETQRKNPWHKKLDNSMFYL
ncbi:hypothetical protein HYALB_00013683 [Hymenoscyphus albidus]|uniref:Piwi domain-containing protein n=1 Tax=Hymenoscyphus albidus TaxID=595503 RepID=A0A9N9LUZ7_9HELO|nr:hypothetical protein HYALB_00013683 [Hymenoscyphus albidus]